MPAAFASLTVPDWLLLAWWMIVLTIIPTGLIRSWRARVADRRAAILSYLKGEWRGHSPHPLPHPSRVRFYALGAIVVLLAIGLFAFVWMRDFTTLLQFNGRALAIAFGAWMAVLGFFPGLFANIPERWAQALWWLVRPAMVLFGLASIAFGGRILYADALAPRGIFDGRIERITIERDETWSPSYFAVLDGVKYRTNRAALRGREIGEHVRVAYTARSRVIVKMEPSARSWRNPDALRVRSDMRPHL